MSSLRWVKAEMMIAAPRLNRIPQPAEWMVSGHRPQAVIPNSVWPMLSVHITAMMPSARPIVAPSRVIHGT